MEILSKRMRGEDMRLSRTKSAITGAAFALMLMFSIGMVTATTAQAQDRNNRWDRNQRTEQRDRSDWNRRQQIERQRAIERARQLAWQREQARSRNRGYTYPRNYPQYGGYGNGGYSNGGYSNGGYGNGGYSNGGYGNGGYSNGGYGGGYNNAEVQKGYRDGLDRGQEDARDRRSPNPNNSSHFRSGNSAYREGFVRGYQAGYRQYGGNRGW
jgi:hypothetical protein